MYLGTSSLLIYNVMKLVTLKRKRKTLSLERYKSGKSKTNFLQEILIKRIPVTLLKKIEIETKQKVKFKKKKRLYHASTGYLREPYVCQFFGV